MNTFFRRYKGIGSLSNLQTASDVVVISPSQRAPSSKPQHVIHNTYSFKNFNSHDKNYELKKSSSTGTTNLNVKKYDTLDSSTSSNSKVHERSRSVNLGIFDMWHKKSHKNKNKLYDRTLYL